MELTGNAVLTVRCQQRFAGPVKDAVDEYKKLSDDEKACSTLNTEGRAYFGSDIEELL